MFDRFGEFDSAEELNRAAAAQKEEGDDEALYALAEENGLDKEDVDDYLDGVIDELANPLIAALGKLKIEETEFKEFKGMIQDDWIMYVKECLSDNIRMQIAVRKKDKSLKGCLTSLLKWSFKNAKPVGTEMAKAAGVEARYADQVRLGIPSMSKAKSIISQYYLGGDGDGSI